MNLFIHEISLQEWVLVGVNCLEDILIIHLVLSAMSAVLCYFDFDRQFIAFLYVFFLKQIS